MAKNKVFSCRECSGWGEWVGKKTITCDNSKSFVGFGMVECPVCKGTSIEPESVPQSEIS